MENEKLNYKAIEVIDDLIKSFLAVLSEYSDGINETPESVASFTEHYTEESIKQYNKMIEEISPLFVLRYIENKYYESFLYDFATNDEGYLSKASSDIVREFIALFHEKYSSENFDNFEDIIIIFSRYIKKDYALIKCVNSSINEVNNNCNSLSNDIDSLQRKISLSEEKATKLQNSINNSEKTILERSVTVLGIFSAIVLTFNVGVSFSNIVLEHLIDASIYRVTLLALIFALIIGNSIIGLLFYLERMYERKYKKVTLHSKQPKEKARQRFQHFISNKFTSKRPIQSVIIIYNVIIASLIICLVICWFFNITTIRDIKSEEFINNHFTTSKNNDDEEKSSSKNETTLSSNRCETKTKPKSQHE